MLLLYLLIIYHKSRKQGHARTFEATNNQATRDLHSVEEVIQEIINKIKNIISQITSKIPEIIKQIEDKINEIIHGLNLDEIIEKIKHAIEGIVGGASEAVQACIAEQQDAIMQLAQDEQKGAQACAEAAAAKVTDIKNRMEKLVNQAMTVEGEVQAAVTINKILLFCIHKGVIFKLNWSLYEASLRY